MKRKLLYMAFWEIVLIIGSVPLFRSLWMFFDRIDFMNRDIGILLSFAGSIIICIVALVALTKVTKV
jgi:hypothetical protein